MITLGTRIIYTHEAAVARKPEGREEWEFPRRGNGDVPNLIRHGEGHIVLSVVPKIENIPVEHHHINPHRYAPKDDWIEKCNKSVMVWEWPGSGVVTGLVTKQVGKSTGSGGGSAPYYEDFEQGYFTQYGNVQLYVVRHELKGQNFVYVPLWAAKPMDLEVQRDAA